MNSNIFIPKVLKVGYQNRDDTFTKKLSYVTYIDQKGKHRKETSWNGWRDSEIEPDTLDNLPREGFVLNKTAGGYDTGWNHRKSYIRVYDPLGMEYEIGLDNLLYILTNTSSIKGKGIEGEMILGWDGKDLVLIPCDSPDYIELKKYNEKLQNKKNYKGKDMIIGATYLTKDNNELVYMGRFDNHGYRSNKKAYFFYNRNAENEWDYIDGKRIVTEFGRFDEFNSLSSKIIDCISEDCAEDYSELFDKLEYYETYNPYDASKDEYINHTLESFANYIMNELNKSKNHTYRPRNQADIYYYTTDGCAVENNGNRWNDNTSNPYLTYYEESNKFIWYEKEEVENKDRYHYSWNRTKTVYNEIELTIKEAFDKIKPQYKKEYLKDEKLRKVNCYE